MINLSAVPAHLLDEGFEWQGGHVQSFVCITSETRPDKGRLGLERVMGHTSS